MNDFLQGENIRLRSVEAEDWEIIYNWNRDTEKLKRFDRIQFPPSKSGTKKWVEKKAEKNGKGDEFFWMIEDGKGNLVGVASTFFVDQRAGTFYYGVAVDSDYRRRGFANKAIRLILRYYFQELRYQKCTAIVYDFNEPSQRLHESLGFIQEGRLRRMGRVDGEYHDFLMYGILAEEFVA